MTPRNRDGRFEVFIIGPMGEDKDDPDLGDDKISEHLTIIAKATRSALTEILGDTHPHEVFSPTEFGASITSTVFSKIDEADLAIADITTRSPSVMYELAFFHALGTPVIVIDDRSYSDESVPFYLKDVNVLEIKDFRYDVVRESLLARIGMFLSPRGLQNFYANPITEFYHVPLVDISASAGLSVGYVDNFLKKILDRYAGVISNSKNGVSRLVLVRPGNDLNEDEDRDAIKKAFPRAEQKTLLMSEAFDFRQARCLVDGDAIVDQPTTLYTLRASARFRRLSDYFDVLEGGGHIDTQFRVESEQRLLSRMIDGFFVAVKNQIKNNNFRRGCTYLTRIESLGQSAPL